MPNHRFGPLAHKNGGLDVSSVPVKLSELHLEGEAGGGLDGAGL